jgi:histidyl-tRNA synthetase
MSQKIQPPKGTRDFYPADMAIQNHIFGAWRRVCARFGFQEYEGPSFEHLELYTGKSGDEIVTQLYNFTDKGGRDIALRPEMTPTLARLANQLGRNLRKPARWFSLPRLWRYEKQQRGRLREFFQLNMDILGTDSVAADAELLAAACAICQELGLTSSDVKARISSRRLISSLLDELGCNDKPSVYLALDRRDKLPREEFVAGVLAAGLDESGLSKLDALFAAQSLEDLDGICQTPAAREAVQELRTAFALVAAHGFGEWVVFDPKVVRGLAYYTGIVYELFDAGRSLRAIAGGGRYDNLLEKLGGEALPAVGFGMGDVVIAELLKDKNLLAVEADGVDFWIVNLDGDETKVAVLATKLRNAGKTVGFSFGGGKMGKQMQVASEQGARIAVFSGSDRVTDGQYEIKTLSTGEQTISTIEELCR